MINLSYRFDQNSVSLEIAGMPDVSKGDSELTIGILSNWSLKIIGSPLLEGEKKHLDSIMEVILLYSRSYISGIRKKFTSNKHIVTLVPFGINHKLILMSTRKEVEPLEIILDDSELCDLTRCLDLLRFDPRFNIKWDINLDRPYTKKYINSNSTKSVNIQNIIYSFLIFLSTSILLFLIPINNQFKIDEPKNNTTKIIEQK